MKDYNYDECAQKIYQFLNDLEYTSMIFGKNNYDKVIFNSNDNDEYQLSMTKIRFEIFHLISLIHDNYGK